MGKKTDGAAAETTVQRAQAPAEGVKTVQEPKRQTPYVLGMWQGMTQHSCLVCKRDTLDGEDAMMQMMVACQRPDCPLPPSPPPAGILVADKTGKPKETR